MSAVFDAQGWNHRIRKRIGLIGSIKQVSLQWRNTVCSLRWTRLLWISSCKTSKISMHSWEWLIHFYWEKLSSNCKIRPAQIHGFHNDAKDKSNGPLECEFGDVSETLSKCASISWTQNVRYFSKEAQAQATLRCKCPVMESSSLVRIPHRFMQPTTSVHYTDSHLRREQLMSSSMHYFLPKSYLPSQTKIKSLFTFMRWCLSPILVSFSWEK